MRDAAEATETVRRRLLRWLREREVGFEELRVALQLRRPDLERELRHVERTVRSQGLRLRVVPPRCRDCGFDFPGRAARHLHPPGRCARCGGARIEPPRFHVAG